TIRISTVAILAILMMATLTTFALENIIDLGTLGGDASFAREINELGQAIGDSQTVTGEWHAFLWTAEGGMMDLGTLGGDRSSVVAINDLGQVVGNSDTALGHQHA
ncbi:MAG: hypothetical protein GTO63_03840, partial [Anaerolineae bacterium]|nr:hypothetical protein [Anaerolineae bacterium]NIN94144.1 hypothetical protein [Anaerolineae bacterium]